jgi:hypothetical protein
MQSTSSEEFDSKLIPILREGIELVKMILFKQLKEELPKRFPEVETKKITMLAGGIVNTLFGTVPEQEPFTSFHSDNSKSIERELRNIPHHCEMLCIPLTDALRTQYLCDKIDGNDCQAILEQAESFGILIKERDVPMPAKFIHLVRTLGTAYGLVQT